MTMWGMDISEVESLVHNMDARAQELEQLVAQLTSQLESARWVGPDRDNFLGEWNSSHVPALRNVAAGLQDAAQRALGNVRAQQEASQS
jgi:uncharacterized protein YukE